MNQERVAQGKAKEEWTVMSNTVGRSGREKYKGLLHLVLGYNQ